MPFVIPSIEEIIEQNEANFESALGQTIPINDKAFLRVLSVIEAGLAVMHNRFAIDSVRQVFATTATGSGLDHIGENYGIVRKSQVSFVGIINQPCGDDVTFPSGLTYVSDSSGLRYYVTDTVVSDDSGYAELSIMCEAGYGADGNVTEGETFTIGRQIIGITSTTATFVSTSIYGTDKETDDAYRNRILSTIRSTGGGGTVSDYKRWAEITPGVSRVFVYSDAPTDGTAKLKDSDMESSGSYWLSGNSAEPEKTLDSHSGTWAIKIFRSTVNNPYIYQYCLQINREYTIQGWARGDGTYTPSVMCGETVLWTGVPSDVWQYFSVTFFADYRDLRFASDVSASGFVSFDDLSLLHTASEPGDRTVYVEGVSDLYEDGIPTIDLIDLTREYITTDPDTGDRQMPLGTTDEKLFVEPIVRTVFDVTVYDLSVDEDKEADCKSSISSGLSEYFGLVAPFVSGSDSEIDKNDTITNVKLSDVLQGVLDTYGASAGNIDFNKQGDPAVTSYTLIKNELAKLGDITYA